MALGRSSNRVIPVHAVFLSVEQKTKSKKKSLWFVKGNPILAIDSFCGRVVACIGISFHIGDTTHTQKHPSNGEIRNLVALFDAKRTSFFWLQT